MQKPATRAARHELIRRLLETNTYTRQENLRLDLQDEGVEVTQATLSRDLIDMRVTKLRAADGKQIYALADSTATAITESALPRFARWCQELLVGIDQVQFQLLVRTPAGAAQLFAAAMDSAGFDGVVGCVAGDDTVLILCRASEDALAVRDALLALADGNTAPAEELVSRGNSES